MNDVVQDRKDRKPSPWARVADAGFSAVLERRGFERVGKALWRLRGDRVVWHYGLYHGAGQGQQAGLQHRVAVAGFHGAAEVLRRRDGFGRGPGAAVAQG